MSSADTLDGSYTLKHLLLIRDANQSPIGIIRPAFQNVYSQKLKRGLGICPTETLRPSLAKAWSIQFHLTENVMRIVALTVIRLNCIVAFFSQCMVIVYSLLLAFLQGRKKLTNVFVNTSTENWELNRSLPTIWNQSSLLVDK